MKEHIRRKGPIRQSAGDRAFNIVNAVVMTLITVVIVYPLYYVLLASITDPVIVNSGKLLFYPESPYFEGYARAFDYAPLWTGYGNTLKYTVVGTAVALLCTIPAGYALSRMDLPGRRVIMFLFTFTMFFSGGLIPSYVINTRVFHLENSPFIYLFYNLVSAYTIFVFRTFFAQIPKSLVESATLDGASELQILTRITLPLSKPVIATFSFMGMITRWNQFEPSLYYIRDKSLYTLQFLLQQVLNEAEFLKQAMKEMPEAMTNVALPSETLKFAICVLAAGPMICVFPFFQKYFSKGMVVGAVKG